MTDIFLPLSVEVATVTFRDLSSTGASRNPYTGAVRTASRGGDRVGASLQFTPAGGASAAGKQRRRAVISRLMGLRGKQNRLILTDPSYTPAGSFPATELLANNDFSSTTGHTASGLALSTSDGVLRATATANAPSGSVISGPAGTYVQYAPYCVRYFYSGGNLVTTSIDVRLGNAAFGSTSGFASSVVDASGGKLVTGAGVALATTLYPGTGNFGTSSIAGQYADIAWASSARCALIDNGPNAALQSDVFGTTWSVSRATITSNAVTAPDGTTTADTLNEDGTAANTHFVAQSVTVPSTQLDYTFSVCVKAGTRSWVYASMSGGGSEAYCSFNVTAGTIGTSGVGAQWTNVRAFMTALGDGWHRCAIVARKASSATAIGANVYIGEADNDITFSGLSAASLYLWRGVLAQSSLPTRGAQTTTTATTGTAQTGSGLYLKGLPASTLGLLLYGDWVEIITSLGSQLAMVMTSLDSDASGLGYLQFTPAIRGSVADNAAVIVHKPMGRFISSGDGIEHLTEPGIVSTASIDLEESPF